MRPNLALARTASALVFAFLCCDRWACCRPPCPVLRPQRSIASVRLQSAGWKLLCYMIERWSGSCGSWSCSCPRARAHVSSADAVTHAGASICFCVGRVRLSVPGIMSGLGGKFSKGVIELGQRVQVRADFSACVPPPLPHTRTWACVPCSRPPPLLRHGARAADRWRLCGVTCRPPPSTHFPFPVHSPTITPQEIHASNGDTVVLSKRFQRALTIAAAEEAAPGTQVDEGKTSA